VVRSRRTDGTRDSRCATSVGRVPRVRPRDEDEHLSRFARRARPPRRDFRHALPGECFTPRRTDVVPTTLHPLSRPQALVNCGHVYHLSCIHRWFNCKKDAASERRGGRRAPPHAPCPKCKEPFDMGSTVTIYLDLVKGAVSPNSAAKPKRRTGARRGSSGAAGVVTLDAENDVVPESPTMGALCSAAANGRNRTNFTRTDATTNGNSPNGNSISIEDQLEQMREETRLASQRAREAEDALAAEIIRRDAETAEDRVCAADVSRLERELSRAKTSLTEAKFLERAAVTKASRVTDELTETKTELQRLRGRLNALETQKKLERDLSETDGSSLGEAELKKRFGEGSGLDPRVAVETLCRALAGKNRQLHVQLEEYAKVTKNLRAKEKALRSAEARNASLQVKTREDEDVVREDLVTDSRKRARETPHDAFASRVSRGWGMDDGLYHDGDDDSKRNGLGRGSSSFPTAAAFSEEDVSFGATRKNRSSSFAARTGVGVNASRGSLHGGGPLSRVPRAVKSGKKKHTNKTGKSGEDLLDDILGSVDANASREASERNKTDRNKKPSGFDLASLASRRRGDLNRDENRIYPAIDLTADDAVGGGGGGSFIIHGADGRGGRTKIVRPGGVQSSKNAVANGGGGASGSLDRFLVRE
jgi:hypothetical protein